MTDEARFLELLPTVDALSVALCRRRGVLGEDAADFSAHVRARFVESNYAPLQKFRGESSIKTYLAVVIASWLKDHLVARDGRWRPSAEAQAAGPMAVHLERLLSRGQRTVDEVIQEVLTIGDAAYTERELRALVKSLPQRKPLRPIEVASETALELPSTATMEADAGLKASEYEQERAQAQAVLTTAMDSLPAEDRLIVSMRFFDGQSVADIARALRLEQKPLYRRLERCLGLLRERLQANGVTPQSVQGLLAGGER